MSNSLKKKICLPFLAWFLACNVGAFQAPFKISVARTTYVEKEASALNMRASPDDSTTDDEVSKKEMQGVEEYRNTVTKVLSNFMQKDASPTVDPFADIDFDGPKIASTTSLETLVSALDCELLEKEWFVTGRVNPSYFSSEFEFQDPDVQLKGIEEYARGVNKLFDQSNSRAQIVSTVVNTTASTPEKSIITCTWRLSGNVNIGFGLPIKPYIVFTDFVVDPKTSLIIFQEDRFDLPPWDILLSALFPFLIGKITSLPSPKVPKREVAMPKLKLETSGSSSSSPFDGFMSMFQQ